MSAPDNPAAFTPNYQIIRPIEPGDSAFVQDELLRNWRSTRISSRGVWFNAHALPGFIAAATGHARLGLLTHTPMLKGEDCEIITLSSVHESGGVGTALLLHTFKCAAEAGCPRVFLTTTNDNLRAIGFYQKRGMRLAALHPDAMTIARRSSPSIPLIGLHNIPLRDELELEIRF